MDRINNVPIYRGTNLSPAESAEIDQLIAQAERLARAHRVRRDARALCGCDCGTQCANGRTGMQARCVVLS